MKPILFSTPMVQAILSGNKTQTRRVIKPQPILATYTNDTFGIPFWKWKDCQWVDGGIGLPESAIRDYAKYQPGDVLWVRETFAVGVIDYGEESDGTTVSYISQCIGDDGYIPKEYAIRCNVGIDDVTWRPSIHMPRKAARIFLRVTNVRAERLQDISINDCIAEGLPNQHGMRSELRNWYKDLWDSINAKRGYGWDANPWVWVYEFERIPEPAP